MTCLILKLNVLLIVSAIKYYLIKNITNIEFEHFF